MGFFIGEGMDYINVSCIEFIDISVANDAVIAEFFFKSGNSRTTYFDTVQKYKEFCDEHCLLTDLTKVGGVV